MNQAITRWKRGDIHPVTGMCFWQYSKCCKNGEYWITSEKYKANKKYHDKYRIDNRDVFVSAKRKYRNNNPDKIRALDKIYKSKRKKKALEYESKRMKEDPIFALAHRCRRRIYSIFKSKKTPKSKRSRDLIGCDWETLRLYFESKFTDGMKWDNRNLWHIDHIIPLASAKSQDEIIKLCHYTNLQPLWAVDNLRKSDKI